MHKDPLTIEKSFAQSSAQSGLSLDMEALTGYPGMARSHSSIETFWFSELDPDPELLHILSCHLPFGVSPFSPDSEFTVMCSPGTDDVVADP